MLLSPPLPLFGGAALGGFAFPLFSGVVLLSPLVWCCLLIPLVGGAFCSWADFSTLFLLVLPGFSLFLVGGAPFSAPLRWCCCFSVCRVVVLPSLPPCLPRPPRVVLLFLLKVDLKLNSTMQQHVTKSNYSTIRIKFSKFKAKWWFAILQVGGAAFPPLPFSAVLLWVVLLSAVFPSCVVLSSSPSFWVLPTFSLSHVGGDSFSSSSFSVVRPSSAFLRPCCRSLHEIKFNSVTKSDRKKAPPPTREDDGKEPFLPPPPRGYDFLYFGTLLGRFQKKVAYF